MGYMFIIRILWLTGDGLSGGLNDLKVCQCYSYKACDFADCIDMWHAC